jgi:hypothetical protein
MELSWKPAARAAIERAENSENPSMYRSLAVRAPRGHHIHHKWPGENNRNCSKEKRPAVEDGQSEENGRDGETQELDPDEQPLPALEDLKDIQFDIAHVVTF